MLINRTRTGRALRTVPLTFPVTFLAFLLLSGPAASPPTAEAVIFRPGIVNEQDSMRQKRGLFKVRIVGTQTNRWFQDKDAMWECDVPSKGSGWERIRFRTPVRRMRISAFGEKRADSAVFAPLPATGTVTRQGQRERGPTDHLSENCFGDGGDGPPPPPPPPDCGTKRIRGLKLSLFALNGKLTLDKTRTRQPVPQLFENCTWSGLVWPNLLDRRANGKEISTPFRPRLVFNPRFNRRTGEWSKVIMIARGTRTGGSFGTRYTTTIEWTATLKRLR